MGAVAGVEPAAGTRGRGVTALSRRRPARVYSTRRRAAGVAATARTASTPSRRRTPAQYRGFHARASSALGGVSMMGFGHCQVSMSRKNFSTTTAGWLSGYL